MKYEGYADVGYEYVNIDDCWMERDRGADGKLVPNPELFPEGIAVSSSDSNSLSRFYILLFIYTVKIVPPT